MAKYLDSTGAVYVISKIKSLLGDKVEKESGKGLSTNDYTTTEKTKLQGIADNANNYSHPAYTPKTSGFYKVTVDSTGHVSAVTAVTKADLTNLGVPAQDTTYSDMKGATASAVGSHGLVPAPSAGEQLKFLRGDGTWEEVMVEPYVLPTASASVLGGIKIGTNLFISNGVVSAKDTTYGNVTTSANGLMLSSDKTKLDSFGSASTYALKSDITNMYRFKGSKASASALPTSGLTAGDVYNIEAESTYGPAGTNVAWTGSDWDSLGGLFSVEAITTTEIDAMFA